MAFSMLPAIVPINIFLKFNLPFHKIYFIAIWSETTIPVLDIYIFCLFLTTYILTTHVVEFCDDFTHSPL